MISKLVLFFIVVLGLALLFGGVALWHISSETEFSRTDAPAATATAAE